MGYDTNNDHAKVCSERECVQFAFNAENEKIVTVRQNGDEALEKQVDSDFDFDFESGSDSEVSVRFVYFRTHTTYPSIKPVVLLLLVSVKSAFRENMIQFMCSIKTRSHRIELQVIKPCGLPFYKGIGQE